MLIIHCHINADLTISNNIYTFLYYIYCSLLYIIHSFSSF